MKNSSLKLNQQGSTLLLAVLILALVIAASLALGTLQIAEVRRSGLTGRSIRAYYAAEEGMEEALFRIKNRQVGQTIGGLFGLSASGGTESFFQNGFGGQYQRKLAVDTSDEAKKKEGYVREDQVAELALIDSAYPRFKVEWDYQGGAAANDKVEISIISWPRNNFNAESIRTEKHLYPLGSGSPQKFPGRMDRNYRVRFKTFCPAGCGESTYYKFTVYALNNNYLTTQPIPDQWMIQSTGKTLGTKRSVQTRMNVQRQAWDIFDYVLFGEEKIQKAL